MLSRVASTVASEARTIGNLLKLPYTKLINDTEVLVHKLDMSRFDEVYALYEQSGETGDGYSKYETQRSTLFERFSKSHVLTMDNADNGEIMAVIPFSDSPACRSTKPMLCTVQALANPKYRGQGVMFEMYKVSEIYLQDIGFLGFNARALITGRNILPTRKVGGMVVGYIPLCSYVDNVGYIDDVLIAKDHQIDINFPEYYQSFIQQRSKRPNAIDTSKPIPKNVQPNKEYGPKEIRTPSGTMRIRSPSGMEDIWQVEALWKQAAEKAEGFGLDEFREDGYYNRAFFREANLLVVENTLGQIVGASVFGPSSLSRAEKPVLSTCYVTINPIIRRQNMGRSLLEYSMALLKKEGFKGVISDTYINNYEMLGLLRKMKYQFLGSLPKCGFIAGLGPTDSLLVYKDL